jgi:hypothetical protein
MEGGQCKWIQIVPQRVWPRTLLLAVQIFMFVGIGTIAYWLIRAALFLNSLYIPVKLDRDERPGVKFKDADLLGIPIRVTLGPRTVEKGNGRGQATHPERG